MNATISAAGVFTYCLLQGLRGDADADQDGKVTFKELKDYIRDKVPELTDNKSHPNIIRRPSRPITSAVHRSLQRRGCRAGTEGYGTLVIRTPDSMGFQVSVDGSLIGTLDSRLERTVRVKSGAVICPSAKGP